MLKLLAALFLNIVLVLGQLSSAYKDPNVALGRSVMVHLFEWKWNDIASECEQFLAPKGYAGIQVSPPSEHIIISDPNPLLNQPWYERYQPVSYKLISRSGNQQEFASMVKRCNDVGVRIYVDAVLNQMAQAGNGIGFAGSQYNSTSEFYPAVPYGSIF